MAVVDDRAVYLNRFMSTLAKTPEAPRNPSTLHGTCSCFGWSTAL